MANLKIIQNGSKVGLVYNSNLVTEMPWEAALEAGRALIQVGRLAEEHEKASCIITDGAILFRKGIPIGLTDNPKIQEEIVKEASWGRMLRRFIPGGIKSRVLLGKPKIIQE